MLSILHACVERVWPCGYFSVGPASAVASTGTHAGPRQICTFSDHGRSKQQQLSRNIEGWGLQCLTRERGNRDLRGPAQKQSFFSTPINNVRLKRPYVRSQPHLQKRKAQGWQSKRAKCNQSRPRRRLNHAVTNFQARAGCRTHYALHIPKTRQDPPSSPSRHDGWVSHGAHDIGELRAAAPLR